MAVKGIIKDIVIVGIGVLAIWIGLQVVFGTPNPFYVVSSGSMIPTLEVFDVLVVNGHESFNEIKVGDIIVFDRPSDHDRVIVHRVAAIIDENPFTVRTKGDANPASIPGTDFPITKEEYIGKVAYVIPEVGYITRILQPPINYIIIVIIIGIMAFKQFAKKKHEKELAKEDPFVSKAENGNENELENEYYNENNVSNKLDDMQKENTQIEPEKTDQFDIDKKEDSDKKIDGKNSKKED